MNPAFKKLFSYPDFLLLPFILLFVVFIYAAVAKLIWQLTTYQRESATIVSCASMHSRSGTRYAPVAQTENGTHITRKVFASNSGCISQVNNTVSVLVNPNDKTDRVILTLGQFWILPLAFIIFSTLVFLARHLNVRRKSS